MNPPTTVIKYRCFEMDWNHHLLDANGWPPPVDAMLPVPLEVPNRNKLTLMVSDIIWEHPVPPEDSDEYWWGRVPVLYRRADELTVEDRKVVAAYLTEKVESHEADILALATMLKELTS